MGKGQHKITYNKSSNQFVVTIPLVFAQAMNLKGGEKIFWDKDAFGNLMIRISKEQ